jgi:hypothetical protein
MIYDFRLVIADLILLSVDALQENRTGYASVDFNYSY